MDTPDIVERLRLCASTHWKEDGSYDMLPVGATLLEAADEITRLRAATASSAAEVEVLRGEVVAWRRRQDWALNVRPGESPEADSTILSSIDELLAARAATDASGALNTQKGGSDE